YATGTPGTNGVPHNSTPPPPIWPLRWDTATWNSAPCLLDGVGGYVTNGIFPNGLLTAGASVEYFFRIRTAGGTFLVPDSNKVLQSNGQDSIDGHRWEHFGVLPDRWKEAAFGGPGMAKLLVVDLDDEGGNERLWKDVADSLAATKPGRYGAHDGWHAIGGG